MNAKHVLVTGASGTVGREVVKLLTDGSDFQITVFDVANNRSEPFFNSFGERIQFISGDISNAVDVSKIPADLDAVIHLAAIIPPLADENPKLARKVNVEGTRLLINHIEKTSPDAFFLYSSSISVYGDRVSNPEIRGTDKLKVSEGDEYGRTKLEAEALIQSSNLSWTIFRLAAIMGNHKISRLMFHMPLETSLEICTPEDTARAFVHALHAKSRLEHQIFNLGGGERCRSSYREFLERSFSIFGLGRLSFPKQAFALHNYHCGNMVDGDELEEILHFRRDTMDTYFQKTANEISPLTKWLTIIFSPVIKWFLLRQSEPYRAYRRGDPDMMAHFFPIVPELTMRATTES